MVTELIVVDNAFFDLIEHRVSVRGTEVPVRFFNRQPKLKEGPEYPSLVIQPFAPKSSNRQVWTHKVTEQIDDVNVKVHKPPQCKRFVYQVTGATDRFDDYRELMLAVEKIFPRADNNQVFITIAGEEFDVFYTNIDELPNINDGVFQFVLTATIYVPVQMLDPESAVSVSDMQINVGSND